MPLRPKNGAKYATGKGRPGRPSAAPRQGMPQRGNTGPTKSASSGRAPSLRPQSGSPKKGNRGPVSTG